jgi:hypothetical protein
MLDDIAPAFMENNLQLFGPVWVQDGKQRELAMKTWFDNADNVNRLEQRDVHVRLRSFSAIPFLHGKRWGDGTIYFHVAQWNNSGTLDYPHSFHEMVPGGADSERAVAYRMLFKNWEQYFDQHIYAELFASDYDWTTL